MVGYCKRMLDDASYTLSLLRSHILNFTMYHGIISSTVLSGVILVCYESGLFFCTH
jgi:hypothetical protein